MPSLTTDPSTTLRRRLAEAGGDGFWRSLEELAGDPGFRDCLENEFPRLLPIWEAPVDRRTALKLLGASLALAGLGGCGDAQPPEAIVSYVSEPEGLTPGVPLHFATALERDGYAVGAIVKNREGRPVKVEGNPEHPASLGASDAVTQAELLSLYDPDRSRAVLDKGRESTWTAAKAALVEAVAGDGSGLHLLTGPIRSPSVGDRLARLLEQYPGARWHVHDPFERDRVRQGARLVFGQPLEMRYRFDRARVILSLDADFLHGMPGSLAYAHQFAEGRRVRDGATKMNRLYCLESSPGLTGAAADHRRVVPAGGVEPAARRLARRLGVATGESGAGGPVPESWLEALARDLEGHRGAALVVPGDSQPPAVHALAHAMNAVLEGLGRTVEPIEPVLDGPWSEAGTPAGLAAAIEAGEVRQLVILDTNPVYTDRGRDWAALLDRVPLTLHWGLYHDETGRRCRWHVPALHALESWGDARAFDGSVALQQPLITPLYGGRSPLELLAAVAGEGDVHPRELLRGYWQRCRGDGDFDAFWRETLLRGVVAGSAAPTRAASAAADLPARLPEASRPKQGEQGLAVMLRPDPFLGDGRRANNAWLQELPRPLTQLSWDNAALIAPATAERLGLDAGRLVELEHGGRRVEVPVFPVPGHAEDALTLHLGYGRQAAGRIAAGVGFDAYPLRGGDDPWLVRGVRLRPTGDSVALANTQHHYTVEGRHLVRHARLESYLADPDLLQRPHAEAAARHSLYPEEPPVESDNAWGMVVDSGACIGCKACVAACQAENNIPVVGREQVLMGREMHWLRVDVWYQGPPSEPFTMFQPVPCMHCEKAPCEYVCPVGATLHTPDGLNAMIYNRCIGTRYCSQNCPYKVRRFNYLEFAYQGPTPPPVHNPEVTVRSRGVMEKCTYCVQRISKARIEARKAGRPIAESEVRTACQQACPTQAIVFGDLNHPDSAVRRYRDHPLGYRMLEELGTRPRTSYLGRITNPNPELVDTAGDDRE